MIVKGRFIKKKLIKKFIELEGGLLVARGRQWETQKCPSHTNGVAIFFFDFSNGVLNLYQSKNINILLDYCERKLGFLPKGNKYFGF